MDMKNRITPVIYKPDLRLPIARLLRPMLKWFGKYPAIPDFLAELLFFVLALFYRTRTLSAATMSVMSFTTFFMTVSTFSAMSTTSAS